MVLCTGLKVVVQEKGVQVGETACEEDMRRRKDVFKRATAGCMAAFMTMSLLGSASGQMRVWADGGSETVTLSDAEVTAAYSDVASYERQSVHDPSIIKSGDQYYVFGSHMGVAKTADLMNWKTTSISAGEVEGTANPYYGSQNGGVLNYADAFGSGAYGTKEITLADKSKVSVDFSTFPAGSWNTAADSFTIKGNQWAPDIIYNKSMGKYCLYLSLNGSKHNSMVALLTSANIEGPYVYQAPVVYSGFTKSGTLSYENTDLYLAINGGQKEGFALPGRYDVMGSGDKWGDYWPHVIDPAVFYDDEDNLWMTYGSWSGGIYILQLDEETGLRDYSVSYPYKDVNGKTLGDDAINANAASDPYFGVKLAGGRYVSGEGSYVEKIGDYYFLFISYGFYSPTGGYNMRIFRSEKPDGPYVDGAGRSAIYTARENNFKNDSKGLQLMGNYQWDTMDVAEVAQGHNSALWDSDGRAYVIYHTKFGNDTAEHQLRVHQLYLNEDGWPVAAPYEFSGETTGLAGDADLTDDQVAGDYQLLIHQYSNNKASDSGTIAANTDIAKPVEITLEADGSITGSHTGSWTRKAGTAYVTINIDDKAYKGVLVKQTIDGTDIQTVCFTAASADGRSIWGSRLPEDKTVVAYNVRNFAGAVPTSTAGDITLETSAQLGASISWTSSNLSVMDNTGKVTPQKEDATVTLTRTIARGNVCHTKDYTVNVLGKDTLVPLLTYDSLSPGQMVSPVEAISEKTGVSLTFTLKGIQSDWTPVLSGDSGITVFLSVLRYLTGDKFEADAVRGEGADAIAPENWRLFFSDTDEVVTISYNQSGSIAFYRDGQLMLTYAANTAIGTATVSQLAADMAKTVHNGKLKAKYALRQVKVDYALDYDSEVATMPVKSQTVASLGDLAKDAKLNAVPQVNETTGARLEFTIEGYNNDWDPVFLTEDEEYVMLSILNYNVINMFEATATCSTAAVETGLQPYQLFFSEEKERVGISYNPDGSIAFYRDGQLMLTYGADQIITDGTNTKNDKVSDLCRTMITAIRNGTITAKYPMSDVKVYYAATSVVVRGMAYPDTDSKIRMDFSADGGVPEDAQLFIDGTKVSSGTTVTTAEKDLLHVDGIRLKEGKLIVNLTAGAMSKMHVNKGSYSMVLKTASGDTLSVGELAYELELSPDTAYRQINTAGNDYVSAFYRMEGTKFYFLTIIKSDKIHCDNQTAGETKYGWWNGINSQVYMNLSGLGKWYAVGSHVYHLADQEGAYTANPIGWSGAGLTAEQVSDDAIKDGSGVVRAFMPLGTFDNDEDSDQGCMLLNILDCQDFGLTAAEFAAKTFSLKGFLGPNDGGVRFVQVDESSTYKACTCPKLTVVPRKEPTETEDGYEQYWKCTACGTMYSDAEGKNEITAPTRIPNLGDQPVKGAVAGKAYPDADSTVTVTFDRKKGIPEDTALYVNGQKVSTGTAVSSADVGLVHVQKVTRENNKLIAELTTHPMSGSDENLGIYRFEIKDGEEMIGSAELMYEASLSPDTAYKKIQAPDNANVSGYYKAEGTKLSFLTAVKTGKIHCDGQTAGGKTYAWWNGINSQVYFCKKGDDQWYSVGSHVYYKDGKYSAKAITWGMNDEEKFSSTLIDGDNAVRAMMSLGTYDDDTDADRGCVLLNTVELADLGMDAQAVAKMNFSLRGYLGPNDDTNRFVIVDSGEEYKLCDCAELTEVPEKAPTTTEAGYERHWKCSVCGRLYSDAEGTTEISEPVAIPKIGDQPAEVTVTGKAYPDKTGSVSISFERKDDIPEDVRLYVNGDEAAVGTEVSEDEFGRIRIDGVNITGKTISVALTAGAIEKFHENIGKYSFEIKDNTGYSLGREVLFYETELSPDTEYRKIEAAENAGVSAYYRTEGTKFYFLTIIKSDKIHCDNQTAGAKKYGWSDGVNSQVYLKFENGEKWYGIGSHVYYAADQRKYYANPIGWEGAGLTAEECSNALIKDGSGVVRAFMPLGTFDDDEDSDQGCILLNILDSQDAGLTETGFAKAEFMLKGFLGPNDGTGRWIDVNAETVYKVCSCTHCTEVPGKEATCKEGGYEKYWKCDRCGRLYSDEALTTEINGPKAIGKKAHSWDEGRVTTAPTTEAEGERTYTCTVCGETRTEVIPKLEPSSQEPSSQEPSSQEPSSQEPSSQEPSSQEPSSQEPVVVPTNPEPSSQEPEPSSQEPEPSSQEPEPSSQEPEPSSQEPEPEPTTEKPAVEPGRTEPSTEESKPEPTEEPSTPESSNPEPSSQEPSSQEPSSQESKPEPATQEQQEKPTSEPVSEPTAVQKETKINGDGSVTTTVTEKSADGSKTVTATTTTTDGTVIVDKTVESANGEKEITESKIKTDGTGQQIISHISAAGNTTDVTLKKEDQGKTVLLQAYKVTGKGQTLSLKKNSSSVKTVVVPDTIKTNGKVYKVTAIEKKAFKNNRKITSVKVGNNIVTIKAGAFRSCDKLKKVVLGKNVKTIGKNVFKDCKKLKTIVIKGNVKKVAKNTFKNIKKNAQIKIKASAKNYKKIVNKIKKSGVKNVRFKRVKK